MSAHTTTTELIRILGRDAALGLLARHGGATIHVPRDPTGHWLTDELGDGAVKFAWEWGGEQIYLPIARREIGLWLYERGASAREIAQRLRISRRTVQRWLVRS